VSDIKETFIDDKKEILGLYNGYYFLYRKILWIWLQNSGPNYEILPAINTSFGLVANQTRTRLIQHLIATMTTLQE